MVLTRNQTIQQGDSQRFVIPVLDGDDPDATFYPDVSGVTVAFAIAESLDAASALHVAPDGQISTPQLGSVKVGSEAFDFSDTTAGEDTTIPDTQDVVVVDVAGDVTETFAAGTTLRYQCRFTDPNFAGRRLTPVKGEITVEAATPFSE